MYVSAGKVFLLGETLGLKLPWGKKLEKLDAELKLVWLLCLLWFLVL